MKVSPVALILSVFLISVLFTGCVTVTPTCPSDMEEKDFTLPLLGGGTLTLSDYLGRPVLLTFFTPNCPHCINEAPLLEAAYQKYKGTHGLVVIGVGYIGGSDETTLQQFVENASLTHPVVIDTPETRIYSMYGVSDVPHSFFFNRCGIIVQEKIGERLELPALSITESVIDENLVPMGCSEELIQLLRKLFDECN
ncbi:MAG: TlpA family protein disulfide reductase, partial [Atribacterota bacterium]|nr:TlpA family protein disulfide reductase [Atribacterota bacterium]